MGRAFVLDRYHYSSSGLQRQLQREQDEVFTRTS